MGNLANALQQLRAERREAQLHVEKLDKAIAAVESANGSGTSRQANQPTGIASAPTRTISAASRRKMARAQKARWAKKAANDQAGKVKPKRTMSASARRKIAAFQRARWAKIKQKKAA